MELFRLNPLLFLLLLITGLGGVSSCRNKSDKQEEKQVETAADPQIVELTALIDKEPDNPEYYLLRSERYIALRDYKPAIDDLEQAINLEPENYLYYSSQADIYMLAEDSRINLPDSRKALSIIQDYIRKHPDHEPAFMDLAVFQSYVKQYNEAIATLDKAIALKPFNPKAWFEKGINFKLKGDTTKAISSLQKSVE